MVAEKNWNKKEKKGKFIDLKLYSGLYYVIEPHSDFDVCLLLKVAMAYGKFRILSYKKYILVNLFYKKP
jgi:hypothetical protein